MTDNGSKPMLNEIPQELVITIGFEGFNTVNFAFHVGSKISPLQMSAALDFLEEIRKRSLKIFMDNLMAKTAMNRLIIPGRG